MFLRHSNKDQATEMILLAIHCKVAWPKTECDFLPTVTVSGPSTLTNMEDPEAT